MIICKRLLSVLLAASIVMTACYKSDAQSSAETSADNSRSQTQAKNATDAFGENSVQRFEQMIKNNNFDFSYCSSESISSGANILHYAAFTGNLNLVKNLVKQGGDLKKKDESCRTVLHYAAESGSLELVQWLIEQGLDVNEKDNDGKNALLFAASHFNCWETVQWLIEQGLDVNSRDNSGKPSCFLKPNTKNRSRFSGSLTMAQTSTRKITTE